MHLAVRQSPTGRRAASTAFALAAAVVLAALVPAASTAAPAPAQLGHLATVKAGHFDNSGHRVLDQINSVPVSGKSGASGTGTMSPAASGGRLPQSLGGGRVAKVAGSGKPRRGASISSSGGGWVNGAPHHPTAFGCGWVEMIGPMVYADAFVTTWDVGHARSEVDYCWAYGVRIVDWPTGYYHCDVLNGQYHYTFTERRRNYYPWHAAWPKSGVYNKTGCRFTGPLGFDQRTWVHVYGHSDGSFYWTAS